MAIPIVCPQCAARLNAPDVASGKKVKCPKCQSLVDVPAVPPTAPNTGGFVVVDTPTTSAPSSTPPTRPTPGGSARPRVQAAANDDDDDYDTDEPTGRKKKKKTTDSDSNLMLIRHIVGGVVLVILLGVAGYIYYTKFFAPRDEAAAKNQSDDSKPNDGVPQKLIPIIPGGPVPGGVSLPKGGGKTVTPDGKSPQQGTKGATPLATPAGITITFPGPVRPSLALTRQLLENRKLSGQIHRWSKEENACLVAVVDLPPGMPTDQVKQLQESLVRPLANLDTGYQVVQTDQKSQAGHLFDRYVCRRQSDESGRTIEVWVTTKEQHIVIALAEYRDEQGAQIAQQFFASIR
ncbi:MAG: zinc-ribbon domain-containing protein [Gemmataceae bacterium]|nr:zinc-ribbon domain-containing protein [Gemmataceae bacterium]